MKPSIILVFAALALGCSKKSDTPDASIRSEAAQVTEQEANDSAERAQHLNGASDVLGSLAVEGTRADSDWYELAPQTGREAAIELSAVPSVDVAFEVLDADRTRLVLVDAAGEGEAERMPNVRTDARIFIRVYASQATKVGGSYTLKVRTAEAHSNQEVEPNNRMADATALPLSTAIVGYVATPNDEDWYRVELPGQDDAGVPSTPAAPGPSMSDGEGGDAGAETVGSAELDAGANPPALPRLIRVDVTAVENVQFEVELRTAADAVLYSAKSKPGEALSIRSVALRPMDREITVVVKSAWEGKPPQARRGYNAVKPYEVTAAVEVGSATAELEPNDSADKATALPPGSFKEGFLSPRGDVDHYVVHVDQPSLVNVAVTGIERTDLLLSAAVANPDGGTPSTIKANDGAIKDPEMLIGIGCSGDCIFRLEAAPEAKTAVKKPSDANAPAGSQSYRITATASADNGSYEREPNQNAGQANAIALGAAVRGSIHPKRDADFFKLDLTSRPVKTRIKATLTGVLKVDVALFLHEVAADGSLSLVQTADRAKGDATEVLHFAADPAVYVLEVRDTRNKQSNFQDSYQLTVQEEQ